MPVIVWIFIALVVGPVGYLAWSWITVDTKTRAMVLGNLGRVPHGPASAPAARQLLPALARKITPSGYQAKLDLLLARAGRPASMPMERLIIVKPSLALVGALLGILIISIRPGTQLILAAVFLILLAYFIPDLLLLSRGQERQKAIQLALPDTLDQMLIAVEAGLGFESAMARAGNNGSGPLAEELIRTLQDMQLGRSRRDSYQALADRTTVPDLKSFVRAIVQADIYGIGLAKVLRTQAKQMRIKRRQRAEEKAMKLPVFVLFPLLFFIFPVLFIIILGPAVINIIAGFSHGGFSGFGAP
ncbi:type II secretion system F family protein [Paenarthrobacter sp. Z7-10]|uniref:type II secretion system F family protein n=1 Tax=Paenarthrobacter sp. Z7-10 TaxID=2787635 RepID=UPI0022A94A2E|nr:type II secretion system F family protein [Paenarthrobacter sp. Z7-10]MCZ2403962.1 type II secretion system F family protein [Paenarthrobacter sp. Z7-10]